LWKLRRLVAEAADEEKLHPREYEARQQRDEAIFLRDIEDNPERAAAFNIYKNSGSTSLTRFLSYFSLSLSFRLLFSLCSRSSLRDAPSSSLVVRLICPSVCFLGRTHRLRDAS
jgi:hypothetical protein